MNTQYEHIKRGITTETDLEHLQEVENKVEYYQNILKNLYQQYTKYTTPCTVN